MKLTQKKKGILLLLFIILLFTFLNLIMDDDSKEGFFSFFKKRGSRRSGCNWICKIKKKLEEKRRAARREAERKAALRKKRRDCINSGGAFRGSTCIRYKPFPGNILKRGYVKPPPPTETFCEKFQKEPAKLVAECSKKTSENECNGVGNCCKWCGKMGKCKPYSLITEMNTLDFLNCN